MATDRESRIALYEIRSIHGQDLFTGQMGSSARVVKNRGGRPRKVVPCPACESQDTRRTGWWGKVRYHVCEACGHKFKSSAGKKKGDG